MCAPSCTTRLSRAAGRPRTTPCASSTSWYGLCNGPLSGRCSHRHRTGSPRNYLCAGPDASLPRLAQSVHCVARFLKTQKTPENPKGTPSPAAQAEDAEEKAQRLAALTHAQGHELVQQTLGLALEAQALLSPASPLPPCTQRMSCSACRATMQPLPHARHWCRHLLTPASPASLPCKGFHPALHACNERWSALPAASGEGEAGWHGGWCPGFECRRAVLHVRAGARTGHDLGHPGRRAAGRRVAAGRLDLPAHVRRSRTLSIVADEQGWMLCTGNKYPAHALGRMQERSQMAVKGHAHACGRVLKRVR